MPSRGKSKQSQQQNTNVSINNRSGGKMEKIHLFRSLDFLRSLPLTPALAGEKKTRREIESCLWLFTATLCFLGFHSPQQYLAHGVVVAPTTTHCIRCLSFSYQKLHTWLRVGLNEHREPDELQRTKATEHEGGKDEKLGYTGSHGNEFYV